MSGIPPPNACLHRPRDEIYIRKLLATAQLSQRRAAKALGINERTMRYYCTARHEIPYVVQYALEMAALSASESHSA